MYGDGEGGGVLQKDIKVQERDIGDVEIDMETEKTMKEDGDKGEKGEFIREVRKFRRDEKKVKSIVKKLEQNKKEEYLDQIEEVNVE